MSLSKRPLEGHEKVTSSAAVLLAIEVVETFDENGAIDEGVVAAATSRCENREAATTITTATTATTADDDDDDDISGLDEERIAYIACSSVSE